VSEVDEYGGERELTYRSTKEFVKPSTMNVDNIS
jgi:hypothetical protein